MERMWFGAQKFSFPPRPLPAPDRPRKGRDSSPPALLPASFQRPAGAFTPDQTLRKTEHWATMGWCAQPHLLPGHPGVGNQPHAPLSHQHLPLGAGWARLRPPRAAAVPSAPRGPLSTPRTRGHGLLHGGGVPEPAFATLHPHQPWLCPLVSNP